MEELNSDEIVKKVDKVEESSAWRAYTERMDRDYNLWAVVKEIWDTHEKEGAINIRSNRIRTFVDKLMSLIVGADPHIRVRPPRLGNELPPQEEINMCNMLERMFYFLLDKADERLRRMGQVGLTEAEAWFGCVRGSCNLRALAYQSDGNVVFDLLPLDPRWTTYGRGRDGYAWINHKEFHTAQAIKDMWGKELSGNEDTIIKQYDFWVVDGGKVWNYVIEGQGKTNLRDPIDHNMSRIPITINPVATQPRIANEAGMMMQNFADAVFASARETVDTLDELTSLVATKAHMMAKSPVVYVYEDETARPDDKDLKPGYYPGSIIVIPKSIEIKEYPQKDISGFLQLLFSDLHEQEYKAMLPPADYGEMGRPPASGTALQEAKQAWDKALGAVSRALSYCYTDAFRLIDRQIRDKEFTIPVEMMERDNFYIYEVTPSQLNPNYYIDVNFTPREPYKDMMNYQLGEMAMRLGVSRDTVLEEFIQLQDVPAEQRKKAIEDAIAAVPTATIREGLEALEEQGRKGIASEIRNYLATMGYQNYAQSIEAEQRITGQGPQGQPPPEQGGR